MLVLITFTVGTQKAIGVGPPNEALLFVICSPVGPYYPNGFKPISLFGTIEYIRAAPGGTSRVVSARLLADVVSQVLVRSSSV